jgi:hypothetical protein
MMRLPQLMASVHHFPNSVSPAKEQRCGYKLLHGMRLMGDLGGVGIDVESIGSR